MKSPSAPLIRRVVRGIDWTVKPTSPVTKGPISPAIKDLLSTPTWSVRSLLPPPDTKQVSSKVSTAAESPNSTEDEITPAKLHHLLRLSALPLPSSQAEETSLLHSLKTHIHFVRAIQSVETTDLRPLITIRDETPSGIAQQTITLASLQPYLDMEEKVGRNGTLRRRGRVDLQDEGNRKKEMRNWWVDVWRLGKGVESRKKGNYLYVKREKKKDVRREDAVEKPVEHTEQTTKEKVTV